jgi:hypothetical protein
MPNEVRVLCVPRRSIERKERKLQPQEKPKVEGNFATQMQARAAGIFTVLGSFIIVQTLDIMMAVRNVHQKAPRKHEQSTFISSTQMKKKKGKMPK